MAFQKKNYRRLRHSCRVQSTVGAPYVRVIGFALEILSEEIITTSLLKALETIVQPKTFIKWECLMYLHHWIANKDSLPLIENVEDRRIKILSQGEVSYLDTHEYIYTKED